MTYESFLKTARALRKGRRQPGWIDAAERSVRKDFVEVLKLTRSDGYDQASPEELEWGTAGLEWYLEGVQRLRAFLETEAPELIDGALECAREADRCMREARRANREYRETVRVETVG